MPKALITGGAGFIGSNLAKALLNMGYEVVTLDLKKGKIKTHIIADVRDLSSMKSACKGVDYVFHLAAVTSPPEFEDPLSQGYQINVIGTYNVLAASLSEGVKRVVIASSSSVYGKLNKPAKENDLPESYANFYPLSKLINELTAKVFYNYGLETVALRYFNVYGYEEEKGKYSSVIWKFIDDIRNRRQPIIFGDGSQRRDFIYIDDAVKATILALERGRPGEAYNIGTGISISFNEAFKIVKEEMKYEGEAKYVPVPYKSYQIFTQADITKAKKELGFEPKVSLREGVRRIISQLK